jgi:hypothetical protein
VRQVRNRRSRLLMYRNNTHLAHHPLILSDHTIK